MVSKMCVVESTLAPGFARSGSKEISRPRVDWLGALGKEPAFGQHCYSFQSGDFFGQNVLKKGVFQ